MRSLRYGLAGIILTGFFGLLGSGCGGGGGDLEKPPEVKKVMDPMRDMPGLKESQDNLKKAGKTK